MITYVNNVFVSNATSASALPTTAEAVASLAKGQFAIMNCTEGADNQFVASLDGVKKFKIGMSTGKTIYDQNGEANKEIKWSNVINTADVKSIAILKYTGEDTEDTVEIDFTKMNEKVCELLAEGGKRIIVRLTFKDLPTRFRKWTESYEYVTLPGDTKVTIAENIAKIINKQWKRARVIAEPNGNVLTLTAMKYDDDNSADSLNWAEKVRFNANIYYTDPAAEGWESLNKHFPTGVTIEKTPGFTYAASSKLVRDREAQAMGYQGILNRGEGTWPVIKPTMETVVDGSVHYDAITLEFENMYRAADDIFRKTKQTVEIYVNDKAGLGKLADAFSSLSLNNVRFTVDDQTEDGLEDVTVKPA